MNENDTQLKKNDDCSNCLALTVKTDYRLQIFSNAMNLAGRMSWKISFGILLLNVFNMFL